MRTSRFSWTGLKFLKSSMHNTGVKRQGQHQGAGQGERVRLRHGPEELPLRAGHGKQRHEGADHDQHGIQQRVVDLLHEAKDPLLDGQIGVVA